MLHTNKVLNVYPVITYISVVCRSIYDCELHEIYLDYLIVDPSSASMREQKNVISINGVYKMNINIYLFILIRMRIYNLQNCIKFFKHTTFQIYRSKFINNIGVMKCNTVRTCSSI